MAMTGPGRDGSSSARPRGFFTWRGTPPSRDRAAERRERRAERRAERDRGRWSE